MPPERREAPLAGVGERRLHQRAHPVEAPGLGGARASAILTHTASPTRAFIFALPRTKWRSKRYALSSRELIRSRAERRA